ncbi:MAG: chloromuconate cycloisomerase [Litorilinea sp.]|nr:MAG: chloromuconate cycloisomerase [Litorilinea sp.]
MPPTPTIQQIDTTVFRLPMAGTLRWGKSSALDEVRHVLVQVTLSDGSVGVAEAPPRPTIYGETAQSITGIIRHELAPRLLGLPVVAEEGPVLPEVQARLRQIPFNYAAKGALDMAIHDALARHRGISLAEHLGAGASRIKVSYILGIGDRETVLAEAVRVVEAGVRVLKVKVGRDWEEDLARITELQAVLGDGVSLYADANECLEAEEAPRRLRQLAEMGLLYCEEPLPVELVRERAALRAGGHLPLIADDSAFSLRDLRRELALDTFDILNIKTARTGYSESHQMLALALQAGKGVMVGSQASAGLGTARAGLFAARSGIEHPSELSFFLKLREDIIDRPLCLQDGYIDVATLASVQVDPDRLRAAAVTEP